MVKKLGLFLAFIFLGVQVFSTLHMAEHGFAKHEHNGHACDVYLHSIDTKYGTPSEAVAVQFPEFFTFTIALPERTVFRSESYRTSSSPRAPPLFS